MNDPVNLLLHSYARAQASGDPNAKFCTLVTLDESGFPVSRTVTVRELSPEGVSIYINGRSPKVDQLKNNPNYELLFFWPSILRQFRLRGGYEIYSSEQQRQNWREKPYAGKLYDLFQSCEQQQSSVLVSRKDYLEKAARLKLKFPETGILEMPDEQLNLRFKPDYIESWVASMEDGLHDRRRYRLTDQGWQCQVLVP
jgi:pyridoxine/pyridoxamine 5'-phosphate oxidase